MAVLDVVVPDSLGEIDECVVVTWLKREGDLVAVDETLVIIQAAKTSVELPAPQAGQVTHILAQQGEVVHKGQTLAQLEVTEVIAQPAAPAEQPPVSIGNSATVRVSPIARRLASEHGVDLTQVTGSGGQGRITEKDVLAFVEARNRETSPAEAGEVVTTTPTKTVETPAVPPAASATIPLAGTRAIIARRMHESLQSMAQLTLHTEADVTELVRMRERLKAQFPVSYTDIVVRASALALRQHPRLNATLDGEVIRLSPDIHVGFAVALEDGLVVPVVRNADRQNLADITGARVHLTDRARANQLSPAEVSGGTFTVTNLGNFDVDGFTPIVNPPEIAILGVGRVVEKLVIYQGKVAQRAMMTLSLTFDHRLVDGAPAAAFLQTIKHLLEAPDGLA